VRLDRLSNGERIASVSAILLYALSILFRIVDLPDFGMDGNLTFEGTIQFPIFPALAAAAGIALGGYLAMREEGFSSPDPRVGKGEAHRIGE
jgi:hypothetical protein